ncbi:hypothetical protein LOY55_10835 [Pseudomonas sp. B21-040]|uniref:hypothetical protein n=1 Tax=Pseudomonas sp. B21-040 TaxID=2895486 RepID=UPI002160CE7B|nr:hypothetical protein [Pseudomonas sp. B21-040]UVL42555.1 hypothetical protein LOY55_10835 [Pseudomonas sp. B21-040]
MHRIDGPGATVDNKFTDGDPVAGIQATMVTDDWANDVQENIMAVLLAAGVSPTKGRAADLLDSIRGISTMMAGEARNIKMSVAAASASGTLTADQVVVAESLSGKTYRLNGFNKTINLATTGVGAMDTGAAPVSGFVALYAIYNPSLPLSTTNPALLGVNATAVIASEVYSGANMPAGYAASALLTVLPTNASGQFSVSLVEGRKVSILAALTFTQGTNNATYTSQSIASFVPKNARKIGGYVVHSGGSSGSLLASFLSGAATGVGEKAFSATNSVASGGYNMAFEDLTVLTAQTLFFKNSSSIAGQSFTPFISSYYI